MHRAIVFTDASFCPETGASGWATRIKLDGRDPLERYGNFKHRPVSSYDAEFHAALWAVWIARCYGAERIELKTDCIMVVKAINGGYHRETTRFYDMLREHGVSGDYIQAEHVQEKDHWQISWCDSHAKLKMRKERVSVRRGKKYNTRNRQSR